MEEPFRPSPWVRNAHLQTIFGSLRLRAWGENAMANAARETLVSTDAGTRLLGYRSCQPSGSARGQIILLHGWEGSADSSYILSAGRFFYDRGYDVFRLNLKDHGRSHHLNSALFHGALTEETAQAVAQICGLLPGRPNYLIGFSLGGNFALRIALRQPGNPIPNLRQIFAISPALDPYKSTLAIDHGPSVYRLYFLAKWKRSLRKKQRLFPERYQFDSLLHHRTCMALTEAVMVYYSEFRDARDYFSRYTLTGKVLEGIGLPVTIITAEDDPVVAVEDFRHLSANGLLHLSIQKYGGHCGFLDPFPRGCWYERTIARSIAEQEEA
ncbi:MAG: alpha/beta fold hydrolase [Deltaproteobacteria bacterium]|nr:alpha/beta fold hydrolase [Deltaproteobacteria bacterium]